MNCVTKLKSSQLWLRLFSIHRPRWTLLSVWISRMTTSPVSSTRSRLSLAQPAPWEYEMFLFNHYIHFKTHLTTDRTAWTDWTQWSARAPASPSAGGSCWNIVLHSLSQSWWWWWWVWWFLGRLGWHQLIDQRSRRRPLQTALHSILNLKQWVQ